MDNRLATCHFKLAALFLVGSGFHVSSVLAQVPANKGTVEDDPPNLIEYEFAIDSAEQLNLNDSINAAINDRLRFSVRTAPILINIDALNADFRDDPSSKCIWCEGSRVTVRLFQDELLTLENTRILVTESVWGWEFRVVETGRLGRFVISDKTGRLSGEIPGRLARYQIAPTDLAPYYVISQMSGQKGSGNDTEAPRIHKEWPPLDPDRYRSPPNDADRNEQRDGEATGETQQLSSPLAARVRVLVIFSDELADKDSAFNDAQGRTEAIFDASIGDDIVFEWFAGPTISVDGDGSNQFLNLCEVRNRMLLNVPSMLGNTDVHDLRDNQYYSDIVLLIVRAQDASGRLGCATVMASQSGSPLNGYAVAAEIHVNGIVAPHELGHVFGLHHESDNGPFSFGHAYSNAAQNFATAMASATDPCPTCPAIEQFSDPEATHNGDVAGASDKDNVRALEATKALVAVYRTPPPPTAATCEVIFFGCNDQDKQMAFVSFDEPVGHIATSFSVQKLLSGGSWSTIGGLSQPGCISTVLGNGWQTFRVIMQTLTGSSQCQVNYFSDPTYCQEFP